MHQRFLPWLLVCALFATLAAHVQAVPTQPGKILVAKADHVKKWVKGQSFELKVDDVVEQSATVRTEKNGSAILLFSNGATAKLGGDSELVIDEFLQDPFSDQLKVATLDKEPTVSRTKLSLNRGELVGDVKIRYDEGSEFTVQTPVGAAGIRGTVFRIVFRPDSNGKAFFQLTTASGNVNYTSSTQGQGNGNVPPGTTAQGTANVGVPQGQEIVINVDVTTNAQGQVVVTVIPPAPTANNAPAAAITQATTAAVEIAGAVQNAVFTGSGAGGGTGGPTGSVSGGNPGQTNFTTTNAQGTVTQPPTPKAIPASQLPTEP